MRKPQQKQSSLVLPESAEDLLRRFSTSTGISEDFLYDILLVYSSRVAPVLYHLCVKCSLPLYEVCRGVMIVHHGSLTPSKDREGRGGGWSSSDDCKILNLTISVLMCICFRSIFLYMTLNVPLLSLKSLCVGFENVHATLASPSGIIKDTVWQKVWHCRQHQIALHAVTAFVKHKQTMNTLFCMKIKGFTK